MTFHRKIGGIHWIALGRLRIAFCITKSKRPTLMTPRDLEIWHKGESDRFDLENSIRHHVQRQFVTYTSDERNMFGGFQ